MTSLEEILAYCYKLPGIEEQVFLQINMRKYKIGGKTFLSINHNIEPIEIDVKLGIKYTLAYREKYDGVVSSRNNDDKINWSTIITNQLDTYIMKTLISHSYHEAMLRSKYKHKHSIQLERERLNIKEMISRYVTP